MEEWEEAHIGDNLSDLLQLTNCSVELFAKLQNIFCKEDIDTVKAQRTPQSQAYKLYETATTKTGGYETLAVALMETKQSGALNIFLEGYRKNGKCVPNSLQSHFRENESRKRRFLLQRKVYTWEQLLGQNVSEQLLENAKEKLKLNSAGDEPISLIREEVSPKEQPEYYIPRTFLYTNALHEEIFIDDSTQEHIFVVKGAPKHELARVNGFQMIDNSRNQLERITVRFIMLDCEADYEKICKISNKPIHMIEYKDNGYTWVKSTRSLEVIRKFLKLIGDTINEEDAIERISSLTISSTSSSSALTIADTPGMGKTFVLANLAARVGETCPNAVILFIVLQEFVKQTPSLENSSTPLDSILTFASTNHTKKSILQEMLKGNTFQFFLFLDGYDEVLQDELHLVDSFLQKLVNVLNIKIIVTTRPHLKTKLENILKRISFEILPFSESNQIQFLTRYWITKHGANESESLSAFAKKCLNTFAVKMTDKERYIAGIPLQCMMLAEVYAEDATRASEMEKLPEDVVKGFSFFHMYKSLIHLKFRRIPDPKTRRVNSDAHVHDALALLFPECLEEFKPHLSSREEIDESTMFSVGLVEKSPFSDVPRFVHRTFAEYILADFVVGNLRECGICVDLLIEEILGKIDTDSSKGSNFKLKHPVIAYFVNMQFQQSSSFDMTDFTFQNLSISPEDVCIAAVSCCSNDLESCFEWIGNLIRFYGINYEIELKEKYFIHLLPTVVENTNSVSFVEKVLNLTRLDFGVELIDHLHVKEFGRNLRIDNCSALHVAVYQGKYNIVMFLLQEYGQEFLLLDHLLHVCVHQSVYESESVIEDKLSIIESFTQLNSEWLEEEYMGRKPLLQDSVHLKLVEHLVKLGADINTTSEIYGTLIHTAGDRDSYSELVRWAMKNGFILINHKDSQKETPLLNAIQWVKAEEADEILHCLYEAGADFNAQDGQGNSVLFLAIQKGKPQSVLQKLFDYGADPSQSIRNKMGLNAADIVTELYYFDAKKNPEMLELLGFLVSNGFDGFNQSISPSGDFSKILSALDRIRNDVDDRKIFIMFFDAASKAADENGDTIVFHAIRYFKSVEFLQVILEQGANVNHRNNSGENPAHFVLKFNGTDSKLTLGYLKALISHGFQGLNETNNSGYTPILQAFTFRYTPDDEVLQVLKDAGMDFNIEDGNGDSILFYAIKYSRDLHFIQKLLEYGASPNCRNKVGRNVAHWIILNHRQYYYRHTANHALAVLKLLVSNGFTGFNQRDSDGNTPLSLAMKRNIPEEDFLKFLRERSEPTSE